MVDKVKKTIVDRVRFTLAFLASAMAFCSLAASYETIDDARSGELGGCTGGDEIRLIDNGDRTLDIVHLFTSTGTSMSFTVPAENTIKPGTLRMLVVGGGGSGGGDCGGGGGAGGLIYKDALDVASATINVGAGGAATTSKEMGKDGSPTTIQFGGTTYTALGGGGGAWWSGKNGRSGGSGGGAVQGNGNGTVGAAQQPTSTSGGYGNAGATSAVNNAGGGGGGAGGAGNTDGSGGSGMAYDISGETTYYAAGGGGGCDGTRSTSVGGSGVGGNGSHNGSKGATDGVAGTGSGGGGDGGGNLGQGSFTSRSGAGGSGVVILRYTVESSPIRSTGAIRKQVGGDTVLIFTNIDSVCSFTLGGTAQARILAVGGGGAGGSGKTHTKNCGAGGGGGAGGFVENENIVLEAGVYNVTVGAGGAAGADAGVLTPGGDGGSSSVSFGGSEIILAAGGGGGGAESVGKNGASGGGGSMAYGSFWGNARNGGTGSEGQGNDGGKGSVNLLAGGGGGAGAAGGISATTGSNGGDGRFSDITGEEVYYAGGGAGGSYNAAAVTGSGGKGGGGKGGDTTVAAQAGADGLGGGGGGCGVAGIGGKGGDGVVIVRISAVLTGPIAKPTTASFVYDGEVHTIMSKMDFAYTITGTASATDVSNYHFKVELKDGFCWNGDPADTAPVEINWSITKAPNAITDLYQPNWLTGETPSTPTCHVDFGTPVYTYSTEENGEYVALDLASLDRGEYWVKATIKETANYDGAEAKASFRVVAGPSESFVYRTSFAVAGTAGTSTLTNFPVLLRLDKSNVGFDYAEIRQAREAGDLRFADNTGAYLPYEIDTWNENGESLIWVRLNELSPFGATISMYWGLRDGYYVEPNNPQAVWTDFAGVWHMNEVIPASQAQSKKSSDSTAGKHDATPVKGNSGNLTQMVSTNAVVGLGRVNSSVRSCANGNRLDTGSPFNLGSKFTFSGWYRFSGVDSGTHPRLVGNKKRNEAPGWSIEASNGSPELLCVRANLRDPVTSYEKNNDNLYNDWVYLAFVFDGDKSTLYSNGRYVNTVTINPVADAEAGMNLCFGANADGTEWSLNGSYDELRITPAALSADWIKTDYEQMRGGSAPTHGPIYDGGVARNGWKVLPSITKTIWNMGEEAGVVDPGVPLLPNPPAVDVKYIIFPYETVVSEMPTTIGNYQVVFTVPASEEDHYEGLEYTIDFSIVDHSPYERLETTTGRIMLGGNDSSITGNKITYQAYYQRTKTFTTFWQHTGSASTKTGNLLAYENHTYWTKDYGEKLWYLQDVRIGNTLPTSGSGTAGLLNAQSYLPWSTPIQWSASAGFGTANRTHVAHMAMRNSTNSVIYSSCFTDGIGTIYFDAVNGWVGNANDGVYGLIVEVATNVIGSAQAPYDENIWQEDVAYDIETDPDSGIVTTNSVSYSTNYYAKADWQPVKAVLLKRDYPVDYTEERIFEKEIAEGEFYLSVINGGSIENFYRIYVPLNYHCPARFRIRRTAIDPNFETNLDGDALILVDNIIASLPPMRADLSSYGIFDPKKGGKETLGQEAAWESPFPAVGEEVFVRAKPEFYVNAATNADTAAFVTAAKMHYRWRYLDQKIEPWRTISLDPRDGFKSLKPLTMPNVPGDIEYWFDLNLQAPFYKYVDYSGTGLGIPGYTEEIFTVTNRASGTVFNSRGTDWFVRLREGKSDYEAMNLLVRRIDAEGTESTVTNVVAMEMAGNHIWRGYLPTPTNSARAIRFVIEGRNRQTPGATDWSENVVLWRNINNIESLPLSGTLVEASDDKWTELPLDGATGYLMFQVDDSTLSLTVVHADYQNFNAWNDAKSTGLFVGNSTEDEGKSGASPKAVECAEKFTEWIDMPATNWHWQESFTTRVAQEYGDYEVFPSVTTPNNGNAGRAQYIYSRFRGSTTSDGEAPINRALQMAGQGLGYLQFVDAAEAPRGLESIVFNARLAQTLNFGDFAYYDADSKMSMTNYTFTTRAAFDLNSCRNFMGNASLSLIAYYRPGKGFYEFRFEQQLAAENGNDSLSGSYPGPKKKGQLFSLYRWKYDSSGRINTTLLGSKTSKELGDFEALATDSASGKYMPMYLSVSNSADGATCIMAGVMRGGMDPLAAMSTMESEKFASICYRDTSSERFTCGTYGLLSANCEGVFLLPYFIPKAVPFNRTIPNSNTLESSPKEKITIATSAVVDCQSQIVNDWWVLPAGRMESFKGESSVQYGFRAITPRQELNIYTGTAGKTDWKLLATTNFNSFGTSSPCVFNVYTIRDCSVKIAAAGTLGDLKTDLVIDDVELKEWRGGDYKEERMVAYVKPHWQDVSDIRGHTNFTFTSAIITNQSLLLSAKRTIPGTPCAIQSPLFDGKYNRGSGLGMFSFSYENAQENVNLILQIATNVTYDAVNNIDNLDENTWVNFTNFTFTAADKARGTRSTYLGLHGVSGVMRLLMDPAVVNSVSNSTNPEKFGEIYITELFCRDEPMLDSSSWWGWNLRTLGPDTAGADEEGRMYLPDLTSAPEKLGLSLALNNSVTADTDSRDGKTYIEHLPFLQTPVFSTNIVGEVSFRARKYSAGAEQPGLVALYGSKTGIDRWERIKIPGNEHGYFVVSNDTYSLYSYKTDPGAAYSAFRFVIPGVQGIRPDSDMTAKLPVGYDSAARVLFDEVLVTEAVRARVGFRNTGAFRSDMEGTGFVRGVPSAAEQPLCRESWGVQCEIYAAMLPDEIDFSRTPRVTLWWYEGIEPWGFENWKNRAKAKSARLARATGTNLVYRSSYQTSPEAVMPMTIVPGTIVQYMLEVEYYEVNSAKPSTNFLSSADWPNPSWYRPVDFNKTSPDRTFSAYTILDDVAPGWAWINEVNLFGEYDINWENSDKPWQYVEVAVPQEADITGWRVELLEWKRSQSMVVTNTLGVFGQDNLEPKKPSMLGAQDNMVFRVLGSPFARDKGNLKFADGTLDGVWKIKNPTTTATSAGELSSYDPFGIRLVRPSGIVEHEIVTIGTNLWWDLEYYRDEYHPTNTVNALNRVQPGADFFYVGDDDHAASDSIGVINERGRTDTVWSKAMVRTPGRINEGQTIDPNHPTPNGASVIVFANLDPSSGHIYQTVGDAVETNGSQMVFIRKGSTAGTNITYRVDPWFELGTVTTNGKPVAATKLAEPRTYVVNVGAGASNNVTVVAGTKLSDKLLDLGLTDDNRYRPAVIDWLEKGKDAFGRPWANYGDDEIRLAHYMNMAGQIVTNLTLTQMFWLDMDPTIGNLALQAGMSEPPSGNPIVPGYAGTAAVTNVKMGVFMMITNRTDDVASEHYGEAWPPYILRSLEPGVTSWDFAEHPEWSWTSVTFKIRGLLANGLTSERNEDNWVALRWFIFTTNSFQNVDEEHPFTSRVEVQDPYSKASPGYAAGWGSWIEEHGWAPVFFSWGIDTKLKPFGIEILEKENYYEY